MSLNFMDWRSSKDVSFLWILLPLSRALHMVDKLSVGVILHLLNLEVAVLAHGAQPLLHLLLDPPHVLNHTGWVSWDVVTLARVLAVLAI